MARLSNVFIVLVILLADLSHWVITTRDSMRATLPNHLLECYRNPQLVKNNLLPMTMPVLIDLIRKVETYQGMNMDMRVLATALLQRFRLDGIERDPDVMANDYIIPYKTSGSEFYKFRFIMDNLIPNQQYSFPNESLNILEQCTLHWMLSSSVDKWMRGDESSTCNSLSNYVSWNSRIRRQVSSPSPPVAPPPAQRKTDPDAEILDPSAMLNDMSRKPNEGYQNYQSLYPRVSSMSDYSLSTCPIENGVVYTMYGAVKAGVILAGIAAGLQPQTVSRRNLIQALKYQGSQGRPTIPTRGFGVDSDYSVNNKWAATLSGEIAEVAILQGPSYGQGMRIGLGGGWNNTFVPRYYFLSEQNKDALTESDIRGGIDGLVIANNVVEWNRIANGGLKLSQLLEMYYSELGVFDTVFKGCQRKSRFTQIAPTNTLLQEGENFAQVLQYEQPSSVNLEYPAIQEFIRIAVSKLVSSVSSMNEPQCSDIRQSGPTATPAADLYIVIDCSWDFLSIEGVLSTLIQKCDVNPYGSRVTLINGKDGSVLVNTTQHITEFHQNFNYTYYNTYARGFDMARALKELQVIFEIEMNIRKQSTSGSYQYNKYYDSSYDSQSMYYGQQRNLYGTSSVSSPSELPKVIIFIPSLNAGSSSGNGDGNYIRNKISYYKTALPDVKLLFFASGSKERFSQYADNPNKDIFTLVLSKDGASSVTPLTARVAEVPRPIVNPTCGSSWVGRWYSTVQTTGYLQPNSIHYYRVHPNYFYKSTDVRIRVQSQSSVTLTVCQSRSNPLPNGNKTLGVGGDTYCRQVSSDAYELKIGEDSCGDLYAFQCQPYYLSVSVSQSVSGTSNNLMCRDDDCRYPQMVKYTLSHEGLTCYSGVIRVIGSPVLIVVLIYVSLKDIF